MSTYSSANFKFFIYTTKYYKTENNSYSQSDSRIPEKSEILGRTIGVHDNQQKTMTVGL